MQEASNEIYQEIYFDNGAVYIGETKEGEMVRHGFGTQTWPDGTRYEGNWVDDKAEGEGKIWHNSGDFYKGEWRDDMAWGKGVYKSKDGTTYEGDWIEDKQEGFGVETWVNGTKYEGKFVDGKKQGKGKISFPDGSYYDGEFEDNNIDGQSKTVICGFLDHFSPPFALLSSCFSFFSYEDFRFFNFF